MPYNVLIVDDSQVMRNIIKRTLKMAGVAVAEVHEAQNGVEALHVLYGRDIDVVFADLNMPEMNGVELVQKMKRDAELARIPVVIISSDNSKERMEILKNHGIRAYLIKPFKPEGLKAAVQNVLPATPGGAHAP